MKKYVTYEDLKRQMLKDPETRREYEALRPEYKLVSSIIEKRIKEKMTQAELAKKVGTKQSAISRLEAGNHNPSFNFLKKVAEALNGRLEISIQ